MPTTTLSVASTAIESGSKWVSEHEIIGPPDEAWASYGASGPEEARLTLTFDSGDLPANAVVGSVAARLWASWAGSGEPLAVGLRLSTVEGLEFVINETPQMYEIGDPAGWGLTPAQFNALDGTLIVTASGEETFAFDALQVAIDWEAPAVTPRRGGGLLGGGGLVGFGGL